MWTKDMAEEGGRLGRSSIVDDDRPPGAEGLSLDRVEPAEEPSRRNVAAARDEDEGLATRGTEPRSYVVDHVDVPVLGLRHHPRLSPVEKRDPFAAFDLQGVRRVDEERAMVSAADGREALLADRDVCCPVPRSRVRAVDDDVPPRATCAEAPAVQ